MMSSSGYICISGIAALECPRPINPSKGQRHIAFDANFFVTDGSGRATVALLHYFAPDDVANEMRKIAVDGHRIAFVVANVCCYFL